MSALQKDVANIAVYDPFRTQLVEFKELNDSVVFNLETKKGMKDAKSHIYKLAQTKSGIEKARVKEKSASLIYGRLVDSEAKDIVAQVDEMIEVHKTPIDEIEQREKDRIAKHRAAIDEIINLNPFDTVEAIQFCIDKVAVCTTDSMEEFIHDMSDAKAIKLAELTERLSVRVKADADAAELDRLKKLEDDRIAKEREETIKQEAIDNERKRVKTSKKQTQNEFVTRETELVADAEQANRDKENAEERAANAEIEAKKKADQELLEKKQADEKAAKAREADKKHHAKINRAAMTGFIKGGFNVTQAKLAVKLLAHKKIPHSTISY